MAYLNTENLEKLITGEKEIIIAGKWRRVQDLDPLYKLMQELNSWASYYRDKGKIASSEAEKQYYEQYRIMNNKSTKVYNYIQTLIKPTNNEKN